MSRNLITHSNLNDREITPIKQKQNRSRYGPRSPNGTVDRPPRLSRGTQQGRPLFRNTKIYSRTFKYRVALGTAGGQTFFLTSLYTYIPFTNTMVLAGTITVFFGLSPTATDLFSTFSFYKINKIFVAYTSVASTTAALPPIYASLQSGTSPFQLGTVSNTNGVNSPQNSVQIDPHMSTSFEYIIPNPSDISQISGNELQGGWIPVAYGISAPTTTTSGVIAFSSGDSTTPAPLTTTYGVVDIEYHVSFKLAE